MGEFTFRKASSSAPADVLEAAVKVILEHPEGHTQGMWRNDCGTGGCLAGWMLEVHPEVTWGDLILDEVLLPSGETWHVSEWATELLGLENDFALFAAALTAPVIEARARVVIEALRAERNPSLALEQYFDDMHARGIAETDNI